MKAFGVSFFQSVIIYISRDSMEVLNLETNAMVQGIPNTPFSTRRLLVGDFESALELAKRLLKQVYKRSFLKPILKIIVQPLEMIEDGLSSIEKRCFAELGEQAGAAEVYFVFDRRPKLSKEDAVMILGGGA